MRLTVPLAQPALQQNTLRLYGELMCVRESWAGKLVVSLGARCSATGLPAAASLAGAASLCVEPEMATAKGVLRDGGLDFLVNTLDEALRTLKNEIRKGRPLAVVLAAEPVSVLREMVERGVQPDVVVRDSDSGLDDASMNGFAPEALRLPDTQGRGLGPSARLQAFLRGKGLSEAVLTWPTSLARRENDTAWLRSLAEGDTLRRRWIEGIPRHQRSASGELQVAWVTAQERGLLAPNSKTNAEDNEGQAR